MADMETTGTQLFVNGTIVPPTKTRNDHAPNFTDTDIIAAVAVAVMAVTILMTILCIVRVLRHRRRAQQGENMDQVPTVYTGTMGANINAYQNAANHMTSNAIVWDPVSTTDMTDSTDNSRASPI